MVPTILRACHLASSQKLPRTNASMTALVIINSKGMNENSRLDSPMQRRENGVTNHFAARGGFWPERMSSSPGFEAVYMGPEGGNVRFEGVDSLILLGE